MVYVTPISGSGKWETAWYGFCVWVPKGYDSYEVLHQSSCTYRTPDEAVAAAREWCETNEAGEVEVDRNPARWGKA